MSYLIIGGKRMTTFPVIDVKATGANISRLRKLNGLSVKDLQVYFGFECPQAIYKWQWGQSLPSIDNLFALSKLFHTTIDEILVEVINHQDLFYISTHDKGSMRAFLGKILEYKVYGKK